MSIENLECDFIGNTIYIRNLTTIESNGGVYIRYISDLESEQILLADLWMIVEMKMKRIKDKYCAYE